jgi:hypothetical protein
MIEDNSLAPAGLPVIKVALWNLRSKHLFEADSLGAQLHLIAVIVLGPSAFVLYRPGYP